MLAMARQAGMRLVGPNCQGITNFSNGAVLTFSTMYLEEPPADGPVAVASQSGSMSQVPYAMLRARGFGVRYCAATGNEADVSVAEVATAMALDPEIRLIVLYLETIRDASWVAELGRVAASRRLPVVALKAGATPAGQSAALSHTAALANEDRVVDAFLEQVGIYRARDVQDLISAAAIHLKSGWTPSGTGVAVVSNSGASCVLTADAIASGGSSALHLAVLQPDTVRGIATVLPGFATATNPVDLTSALLGNSGLFSQVLPLLGRDPSVDALIVAVPVAGAGYDVDALAADAGRFAESGIPTIVVSAHAPVAEVFRSHGLPVFATENEAVAALDQWMACHGRSAAAAVRPRAVVVPEPPAATEVLDEAASLDLLAAGGVPTVPRRLCCDADAAARALLSFGAPVVAKGCTSRVTHKSDEGLVVLGLRTEDEVRRAYSAIDARLRIADPDAAGILVAPMVGGGRELMIGARVDPVFGALVLVGDGGGHVEVLPDLQVLLPPFDEGDVLAALRRLRIAPLLAGIRGQMPADVGAFAMAAVAVGHLIGDARSGVVELDINPVIVGRHGEGCVAVDAVIRRART
jgi:acyl-CoA synthetase (NDP forming)